MTLVSGRTNGSGADRQAAGARLSQATGVAVVLALLFLTAPAVAQLSSDDIAALRKRGQTEGWTFEVAESEATAHSLHELCGSVPPPPGQVTPRRPGAAPREDLPVAFDWRDYGGCTPIKSQGSCGSCWAFNSIGMMESYIKLTTSQTVDLSEQWLVSCTDAGSCSGGWHGNALYYLECVGYKDPCGDDGAVLESAFPYQEWDAPCGCPYDHPYCITDWDYVSGLSIPSVQKIKEAIFEHGPVAVSVHVNDAFHAYGGGVFNDCENEDTNHGVVLVGWDDNQGTDGVWILRNSWGKSWGIQGYMKIEYGCSKVGFGATYIDYKASDCNNNGINDVCEVDCDGLDGMCQTVAGCGTSPDCNDNDRPDDCDLDDGSSADCNSNGIPDECDIADGTSQDCQYNGIPDECDLADGTSLDCQPNDIPDECEEDCNGNQVPDDCDIRDGYSYDLDESGIPDECEAPILYVDASAGGLNNGTSWTDAYLDLQDALTVASAGGIASEIWVVAGVYTPDRGTGDREATFRLTSGTMLYGGFAGGEASTGQRHPGLHLTVLSGDLAGDDHSGGSTAENAYHVVTGNNAGKTAGLDGFVITGGNADSAATPNNSGAGIYNHGGDARFVGCRVVGNTASFGGGMYNKNSESALVNCMFADNSGEFGGAVFNEGADVTITNCTLGGNTAEYVGAGMYNLSGSDPVISNCVLWGNSVGASQSESAQIKGGSPEVNYCCIQNWTGDLGGTGNIGDDPEDDPQYADPDGADDVPGTVDDDLSLSAGTRCIDAGDNLADTDAHTAGDQLLPATDVLGDARFVDDVDTTDVGHGDPPIVDMGAYEFGGEVLLGDFDADGDVDLVDFLSWEGCMTGPGAGPYGSGCGVFDFESDGDVDLADFAGFQGAFTGG